MSWHNQAFQSGEQMDVDASAIPQGVALDDNMIKQIRSKVQEKIDAVGSATLKSMGVTFATKCDENAGIDVDANQVAYLWKAGAKMAAFAAIMLIAACVVGFAASKGRCRCRQGFEGEDLFKGCRFFKCRD